MAMSASSKNGFLILGLATLLLLSACTDSRDSLDSVYQAKKANYSLKSQHLNEQGEPLYINELIRQDSLYLLQHANNPVQWLSWSDAAFAKAKELNKPVFLSIGYSTCHWCHVMARESFDNVEIAEFINAHFVPIKVDREEHPSVDELYLTSVQLLSGKAGWPLTAVLTPEGQAFFGGTYFKPNELLNLLKRINETWLQRQDAVLEQAQRLSKSLEAINKSANDARAVTTEIIDAGAEQIRAELEREASNPFGQAKPGFPREPEILFLLDQARRDLSFDTIQTVSDRLLTLASGGIHDHIDGGFHRYTVDSDWQVPHFEKMLYNQAQLGRAYFQAYQLNGNPRLKEVGAKTLDFLLATMQSPRGGFYSAMDAQSEQADGELGEGAYYVWSFAELEQVLTQDELGLAEQWLGVSTNGNFEGLNVLQNKLLISPQNEPSEFEGKLKPIIDKLAKARAQRTSPQVDEKIITAWNAMAISALLNAHQVAPNTAYLEAATKAATRLWTKSFDAKLGVSRTLPSKQLRVSGTLEDHAYFANALVDLYDTQASAEWLERANQVAKYMIAHFYDSQSGGFQLASNSSSDVPIAKLISARDDATYSANSLAAQVLAKLWHRTGEADYKHKANSVIAVFSKQMINKPQTLSGMLLAANLLQQKGHGKRQYAAKGKVSVLTKVDSTQSIELQLNIEDGWHINAAEVLSDYLIPTRLQTNGISNDDSCALVEDVLYPQGKRVSLSFQDEELLVYEGSVSLKAKIDNLPTECSALTAQLQIQACSDEVCLAPDSIEIRAFFNE